MASSLKNDIQVMPQDLFAQVSNVSTTVPYNTFSPELGVRAVTGDGREFRYVQAGASALIIGQVQQSPAIVSTLQAITAPVLAVGTTSVTLTISSTTIAAGALAGGQLLTYGTVANGGGQSLRISNNTAVTAGTSITITLDDPIAVATTASATIDLIPNAYTGVIQLPTTNTNTVAGVAVGPLPASYYGWVQIAGQSMVLIQGTPAAFAPVGASVTTAGALAVASATIASLGINLATGVNGQYGPVRLNIN